MTILALPRTSARIPPPLLRNHCHYFPDLKGICFEDGYYCMPVRSATGDICMCMPVGQSKQLRCRCNHVALLAGQRFQQQSCFVVDPMAAQISHKRTTPRCVCPIDPAKHPWEQEKKLHNRWHPDIPHVRCKPLCCAVMPCELT